MNAKNTIEDFEVGMEVNVEHQPDDLFNHDFTGIVTAIRPGSVDGYVSVKDQDDDVWDCDPRQLSYCTDAIMHQKSHEG